MCVGENRFFPADETFTAQLEPGAQAPEGTRGNGGRARRVPACRGGVLASTYRAHQLTSSPGGPGPWERGGQD